MAVLNYLVFLPESKGGTEYIAGWSNYGLTASIIIFISIYASAIGTHRHIPNLKQPPPMAPFNLKRTTLEIKETLNNRSFFALFIFALLYAVAAGVSTSLSIYFSRHLWELTTFKIGIMNLPYYLSALIALFIAPRISKWLGKKKGAMTITGLAFALAPLPYILRMLGWFPENNAAPYILMIGDFSLAINVLFNTLIVFNTIEVTLVITSAALIAAMIADVVEDSEVKTGRRSEGIFFAANSFSQKAVNGLGVVVAGQILAYVQFPTQAKPGEIPDETLFDLALLYVPVLLFFYLMALMVLNVYQINRDDHEKNLRELTEQK